MMGMWFDTFDMLVAFFAGIAVAALVFLLVGIIDYLMHRPPRVGVPVRHRAPPLPWTTRRWKL